MRTLVAVTLAGGAMVILAACGPEPQPPTASISYEACMGLRGTCSDNCCAYTKARTLGEGSRVECKVLAGPGGTYRLTFEVRQPDNDVGIDLTEATFANNESSMMGVSTCQELVVREDGNGFPSETCNEVDVEEEAPYGGGCEVQVHVNGDDVVEGRFRCKELQLPSQALYFSTVHEGSVAWGTFSIDNCDINL